MRKPTTTPDRIRIALKEPDPKNGAMVAFDRKQAGKVLINAFYEVVVIKEGHAWPKDWLIPKKYAAMRSRGLSNHGKERKVPGAAGPLLFKTETVRAQLEPGIEPTPITMLRCPACGGGLEIPEKDTTQQCLKCWRTVKISVVVKRSIVISISD